MVDNILEDINLLLGEYIRALVLLSASSFTAHSLFLGFSGAPYAVLLAGIAAIGEFIPVVGPAAAGLIVVLVTSLSGYTHVFLYVIFWMLFRLVQDYIVSPYLMSKGVQLNPMLVLFGVLAGDQIAGVLGMFLSVPAACDSARSLSPIAPGPRGRDLVPQAAHEAHLVAAALRVSTDGAHGEHEHGRLESGRQPRPLRTAHADVRSGPRARAGTHTAGSRSF